MGLLIGSDRPDISCAEGQHLEDIHLQVLQKQDLRLQIASIPVSEIYGSPKTSRTIQRRIEVAMDQSFDNVTKKSGRSMFLGTRHKKPDFITFNA